MYHDKINDLTIRDNELEQKIKDIEILKSKVQEKLENVRRIILTTVGIAAVGHLLLAPLIHPVIGLASMLVMLCTVPPGGIIFILRENKIEKYEKEIEAYNLEIEQNKIELDRLYTEQETKSNNTKPVIISKKNIINNKKMR